MKLLNELPIVGLGVGGALTGLSLTAIGYRGIRKDFLVGGLLLWSGVCLGTAATQVTIGAIRRVRSA